MNLHAILIIDLVGLVFVAWVLNLVRNGRLDLAYGLLWLTGAAGAVLLVTIAPLRRGLTRAVGAVFPASALALVAFLFIFVVLVILSVQVSALIRRQGELVKALARQRLREEQRRESAVPDPGWSPEDRSAHSSSDAPGAATRTDAAIGDEPHG